MVGADDLEACCWSDLLSPWVACATGSTLTTSRDSATMTAPINHDAVRPNSVRLRPTNHDHKDDLDPPMESIITPGLELALMRSTRFIVRNIAMLLVDY